MWAATTQASNWMMTELYARDVRRQGEKMPPMARVYLYPEARERFPELPSAACAAIEQAAQRKYRALRYKLIWTCQVSLPTYRYPVPYPIPANSWSIDIENTAPIVNVRLGDGRMRLRLKGGPHFRRQRAAIDQMIDGSATRGQMALYEKGKVLMCKMVSWLPREKDTIAADARTGTLMIRTANDSLIVAANAKNDQLWTYHGDHIRRWSAEHRVQLQRWSDDHKAEHRPVPPFAERRQAAAVKYRNRMNSACHEVAALVAGYAQRRRFAAVSYTDAVRDFCPTFPWYQLRQLLAEKLDAAGLAFDYTETEPADSPAGS
jgi:hypothetical protein